MRNPSVSSTGTKTEIFKKNYMKKVLFSLFNLKSEEHFTISDVAALALVFFGRVRQIESRLFAWGQPGVS